eukprot:COSAG06_NODE_45511_length_354_cov_0.811765_2_plen_28_part_01
MASAVFNGKPTNDIFIRLQEVSSRELLE